MTERTLSELAFRTGKQVGRAEGINECSRLLMRFIPRELRGDAAMLVMVAATAAAEEALEPEDRTAVS